MTKSLRSVVPPSVRTWLFAGACVLAACDSMPTTPPGECAVVPDVRAPMCQNPTGDLASCKCSVDDYAPRFNASNNDTWPACVSDAGLWVLKGTDVPAAAARTVAFDTIAGKLWNKATAPMAADFMSARDDYAILQGIGSRVARRQDVHYPELVGTDKFGCTDATIAGQNPDRCAGPARLKPIVDQAFVDGLAGTKPRVQAARLEAALQWFFYLSVTSEIWTCSFDDLADCDSAWAYLNGSKAREAPIGLGATIRQLHPETYDRIFDGLLAERCWRDLDPGLPMKCDAWYQRALNQTDRPLTRGMALLLKQRISKVPTLVGEEQEAALVYINLLGGFLDRAARAVDPQKADQLKTQTAATTAAGLNATQAQALIDSLFGCP